MKTFGKNTNNSSYSIENIQFFMQIKKYLKTARIVYFKCQQLVILQQIINKFDMNLNKKQSSMNDLDKVDPDPGANRIESGPSIPQFSRNPTNNSIQEQYLQVVQKKQQVFGDQADFLRLLSEVKKKDPYSNLSFKKNEVIKKKQSQKKQEQKPVKIQQTKKERLLKIIQPHVKHYKALNNSNPSDNDLSRLRSEHRQKIFKFLMYGIEQLKQLRQTGDLSPQQLRVANLTFKDPYMLAKSITTEIDLQFLRYLNQDNKLTASKKFKTYLKTFSSNMADQSNIFLRRKVLSRQYKGKTLASMNEQQFYPPHIRQKLIQKQNLLLREAAAQQKPSIFNEQNQYEPQPVYQPPVVEKKQEEKKPKYKYIQQSSLVMLRDLLLPQQIVKMRNLLQFQNRKDIQVRLVENITKVFENVI